MAERITHQYSDLPSKGLGRSFDSVNVNEPVIIPSLVLIDSVTWIFTKANILSRANELKAELCYCEIDNYRGLKLWFRKH